MSPPNPQRTAAPTVLLLVCEPRQACVRDAVLSTRAACAIRIASNVAAGTLALSAGPVDLLILDRQFEPEQPLALIHLVARLAPKTVVLAFDEQPARLPIRPYTVSAWADLTTTLTQSLAALDGSGSGASTAPPSSRGES